MPKMSSNRVRFQKRSELRNNRMSGQGMRAETRREAEIKTTREKADRR